MDVAKRFVDWTEHPPEQWLTTINRYLPQAVTALLVIAIAYQLAGITWSLVPSAPQTAAPVARQVKPNPSQATGDLDSLRSSHLFGEASKEAAPVVANAVDAPETTLSLTLTGILAGGGTPQAIISANRGQEKTYHIGDTIDNADGATLYSVEVDRVLLNRNGNLEALRLPEKLSSSTSRPTASLAPPVAQPAGSLRQVISANASRITDIVRIAPHVQEGKVIGFRVTPGRDRASFDALGLQPGDVVTDINGTVLNDPSQGLQVFESLGETTQANVTVLRDGAPQVVVIDTSQLQKLEENRE
jgi:general secretion pathway protein C